MAIHDRTYGGYRVFVGDLGSRVGKYELEREFEYNGPLLDVWVARNPPGFAFLVYKYAEDAERAVRELDGRIVCGRRVRVEHARPYEPRRYRGRNAPYGRGPPPPRRRSGGHRSRSRSRERRRSHSRSRSGSHNRSRQRKDSERSRDKSLSGKSHDKAQENAKDKSKGRSERKESKSKSRSRSRSADGEGSRRSRSLSLNPEEANQVLDEVGASPEKREEKDQNGEPAEEEGTE